MAATSRTKCKSGERDIEARERVLHQHREDLAVLERLRRGLRNERSRERYREKVGQAQQGQRIASTAPSGTAIRQPDALAEPAATPLQCNTASIDPNNDHVAEHQRRKAGD